MGEAEVGGAAVGEAEEDDNFVLKNSKLDDF